MKIHSEYLKKDFQIKGDKICHEDLEDIIINQLNLKYKFKIKEIDDHPAVLCTIEGDDRCIQAIGEADEDEKSPTVLAGERAFDKAACLYLNIKIESSDENIVIEEESEETMEVVSAPIVVAEEKEEEIVPAEAEVVSEPELVEEPKVIEETEKTEVVEPPVIEKEPEIIPELEPIPEERPDPIITIGRYKGANKKASEVVKTDRSWAEFIVDKMKNAAPPLSNQINAMNDFLKE